MAIQSAQAKIYSYFETAVFGLRILSTDIFENTGSTPTSTATFTLFPTKIMRLFPALAVTPTMTTTGNYITGFTNRSPIRPASPPPPAPDPNGDNFISNDTLSDAQDNFGINLIGRTSFNLRIPTTINIDLSKVTFPVSPLQSYTISLTEDFFTEEFNNLMPSPAIAALTTITAPNRPIITGHNPFNGQTDYRDNTKLVIAVNVQDVPNALTRGGGFFRLYKNGVLRTSINILDGSKVSISGNKITLNVLGLIDAGANYYLLIDNGVVSSVDGFLSQAVTSTSQIAFATPASTDIQFPDLIALQVAAANLLVPQSEIIIFGNSSITATASLTAISERVKYVSGTTDTVGGLITQVSALVEADVLPMVSTSTITANGTFILANGRANLQTRFAMDFFVQMEPTTISAAFAITKADISVRKPADFRLTSTSTLSASGGYRKNASAALTSTSSFSCSTTAVARATVLKYDGFRTGSVIRLPLYGNVNATVQWGGGQTHRFKFNLHPTIGFVPQNTPGSTAYYYQAPYFGDTYGGGGYKQNITYTSPGVKTFTVPSFRSVTFNGQVHTGPDDFDGYVIIRGQVDYIGALQSEDAQGFSGSLTSSNNEDAGFSYLTEVLSWGDGIKGFRNIGTANPNAPFTLNYISPNFPSSMTELREAFAQRVVWDPLRSNFPTSPDNFGTGTPAQAESDKLYQQSLQKFNRATIKNVVENMNTAAITTMAGCFKNARLGFQIQTGSLNTAYYVDLSGWNTSNVTTMREMFQRTEYFIPKGLQNWNTSLVSDFSYMFNTSNYITNSATYTSVVDTTIGIAGWNTSSATTMKAMFGAETTPSNIGGGNANASGSTNARFGSLSGWNTANVTDMSFMFSNYTAAQTATQSGNYFTPTASLGISGWNTSKVTTMRAMFQSFGGWADDISGWDTSKVTDFAFMFSIPVLIAGGMTNPNVTNWNTSSATNMMGMFMGNVLFNRPIARNGNIWNTSKVTNMTYMFWSLGNQTELFNQNLSNWCVPLIASKPVGFDEQRGNTWTQARPVWGTCP